MVVNQKMIIVTKLKKNTPYSPNRDKKNKLIKVELKNSVKPKKNNGVSRSIIKSHTTFKI